MRDSHCFTVIFYLKALKLTISQYYTDRIKIKPSNPLYGTLSYLLILFKNIVPYLHLAVFTRHCVNETETLLNPF